MKPRESLYPVLRRCGLVLVILAAAALQNTFFSGRMPTAFLLIPAAVSAAIYEKEFAGTFFGILCGALWDLASPVTDGVFTLIFAVCACACGLLSHYVFRNTLAAALLQTAGVTVIVLGAGLLSQILRDPTAALQVLTRMTLPSAALTAAVLPLFYYPVRLIEKLTRKDEI